MSRRPVLRVALLCISVGVVAFATIGVTRGIATSRYEAEKHRAIARTTGTVIEDGIGDEGDVRVRWTDLGGHDHVQRFGIYNTDRYVEGAKFKVAYNPADPNAPAFAGDPEETSAEDDLWVPILFAGLGLLLLGAGWTVRGIRYLVASGRPEQRASAEIHCGDLRSPGPVSFGLSCWLRVSDATSGGSPRRWQRVMWHPALDGDSSDLEGCIRGDLRSQRPVVFVGNDGYRLVPIGRLRAKLPKRVVVSDREVARSEIADTFIVPSDVVVARRQWWWRRALVYCVAGASAGAAFGYLVAGLDDVPSFAAAAAAVAVNLWGFRGAEP